jgi:raffinose/stachyose/melibiose transport system permease protein
LFPFAVTLINNPWLTSLSLGVSQFQGVWATDYGAEMTAAGLVLIPQLIIFAIFQGRSSKGWPLAPSKAEPRR